MESTDKTHLYFIALVVHGELAEKIRTIQLYCSETYQSKKALRSPPHVTIASGDLRKQFFHPAWQEFESKEFNSTWNVSSAHLLKHDGKKWNPLIEFSFTA